jgi:hypothetical protein
MANISCAPLHLDRPAAELAADDERQAALSRQSDELEALSALFSADGESVSIEESGNGELSCTLTLQQHGASLSIALPELYPTSVPPRLAVSIPALRASLHSELVNELAGIASAGVADDREVLFEVCQAFQSRVAELLASQQPETALNEGSTEGQGRREARPQVRKVAIVWFHHVKSQAKRKQLVAWARDAQCGGFSKPGFPGVVAVEGEADAVQDYLAQVRELRWQAMEVRWEAERAEDDARCLREPFFELAESAMGEAAALCDEAGLLADFRAAVLKLPSKQQCT